MARQPTGTTVQAEMAPAPVPEDDMSAVVHGAGEESAKQTIARLERDLLEAQSQPRARIEALHLPEAELQDYDEVAEYGGIVDEEAQTVSFNGKTFPLDPKERAKLYAKRNENLAAGPRKMALPPMGEFLPARGSYRGVPYRTNNGVTRVDW